MAILKLKDICVYYQRYVSFHQSREPDHSLQQHWMYYTSAWQYGSTSSATEGSGWFLKTKLTCHHQSATESLEE